MAPFPLKQSPRPTLTLTPPCHFPPPVDYVVWDLVISHSIPYVRDEILTPPEHAPSRSDISSVKKIFSTPSSPLSSFSSRILQVPSLFCALSGCALCAVTFRSGLVSRSSVKTIRIAVFVKLNADAASPQEALGFPSIYCQTDSTVSGALRVCLLPDPFALSIAPLFWNIRQADFNPSSLGPHLRVLGQNSPIAHTGANAHFDDLILRGVVSRASPLTGFAGLSGGWRSSVLHGQFR